MKIEVDDKLIVRNPTQEIRDYCRHELVVPNPDYYKKQAMGKWTGNLPMNIYLYEKCGEDLWLPFGCLHTLWKMHPHADDYKMLVRPIERRKYESSINLYDYQEQTVRAALKTKNGLLVMPCGAGKTQTGLELIARIGGRALWLTHTQDLLNQSKERAKNTLNLCGGTYGTITGGKVNIGTHITFATVQTMAKLNLYNYKDMFDVVIVDECQRCAGSPTRVTQFYKVVSSLSARYKIGLTATPKRADGLEKSMFALLGGIIHEVPKEAVKATTCPIKVQQIETGYKPLMRNVLMGDGTIDYSKIVEDLIHSDDRYNIVFGEILSKCKGPTIILANRVEYLQRMCDDLAGCGKRAICLSTLGQSKKAKQMRKESMQKLNAGELNFVLATYALAKEGLDCPDLRYVVFATPEKDSTTVIQSAGRVGRKAPGKEYGTVIDFVDDFGMYRSWKKKREAIYKKIDAEIE
jgi:superfamily II DNA or RNA helicase